MMLFNILRRPVRATIAFGAAAAVMLTPALAAEGDCSSLRAEHADVERQMVSLVVENPGIHIIIGLCAASANDTYERTKDSDNAMAQFAVCAGVGCLFAGVDSCLNVADQWFELGMRASRIEDRMRESC